MKARYIREGRAVNPAFSNKEKRRAVAAGEPYDVEPYIIIPIGFEEEGPFCWTHCCPGHKGEPPLCEPVDDECRQRVENWMTKERPRQLELIRQMLKPDNLKKISSKAKRDHIKELGVAYGLTPDEDEPPARPMPSVGPKPNSESAAA